jgi:hypothetical protein
MQAPKITSFNGQECTVRILDTQTFVTGVKVATVKGQLLMVPENKTFEIGTKIDLQPTVSADHKFVNLHLKANFSELIGETKLFPVTSMITPQLEGGFSGVPVPFTQFIQQPNIETFAVDTKACIPDGGTMLIDVGQSTRTEKTVTDPPVLSKVPYINRLFKNVGLQTQNYRVLVLATPRIIINAETEKCGTPAKKCCDDCATCKTGKPATSDEEASVPPQKVAAPVVKKSARDLRIEKMAAELVEKYHQALADGDPEKARTLAVQALDLDPACFGLTNTGKIVGSFYRTDTSDLSIPIQSSSVTPTKDELLSAQGYLQFQARQAAQNGPICVKVTETPAGFATGVAVNSDSGLTGTIILNATPAPTAKPACPECQKAQQEPWWQEAMDEAIAENAKMKARYAEKNKDADLSVPMSPSPKMPETIPAKPACDKAPETKSKTSWFRRTFFPQTGLAGTVLPSSHYLDHKPQYFPPDPDFPLQKELATPQAQDAADKRMKNLINSSESSGPIKASPAPYPDVPSKMTPDRVHGGIQ